MDPFERVVSLRPAKKAFSLIEEFKHFAFKGNVIDLAVGVIIGGAFAKIIDSLVKNIIMPLVSVIIPAQQKYQDWTLTLQPGDQTKNQAEKLLPYGLFLSDVVNFLVVAAVLFIFVVKFLGWVMRRRREEAAAPPPPLSRQEELLTEIRDLLQQGRPPAPAPPDVK